MEAFILTICAISGVCQYAWLTASTDYKRQIYKSASRVMLALGMFTFIAWNVVTLIRAGIDPVSIWAVAR